MPSGRPKNGKPNKTEGVRIRSDLEEMIRWICRAQGVKSAVLLDPIIRGEITAIYNKLLPLITQLKKAEEEATAAAIAKWKAENPPLWDGLPKEEQQEFEGVWPTEVPDHVTDPDKKPKKPKKKK